MCARAFVRDLRGDTFRVRQIGPGMHNERASRLRQAQAEPRPDA